MGLGAYVLIIESLMREDTIKNKFPIPIIDRWFIIIDDLFAAELKDANAKYFSKFEVITK